MVRRASLAGKSLSLRRLSRASDAIESISLLVAPESESVRGQFEYGTLVEEAEEEDDTGVAKHNLNEREDRWAHLSEERRLLKDEMGAMLQLALPVIITYLLEMLPGIVTLVLVGRADYGDESTAQDAPPKKQLYMDAAALANMLINIVAISTGVGVLSAMDTLCGAAHGAGRPSSMGSYLLTATFITSIVFLVVAAIMLQTENVLLFFSQPLHVAQHAGVFAMWMIPGIPFVYKYEMLRKITQARNEALPMVVSALAANVVNVGVGYYLVNYTEWGWLGAAWARSLANMAALPTLVLGMLWCGGNRNTSDYDEREAEEPKEFIQHLMEGFRPKKALSKKAIVRFLRLGIPGCLQMMFEWVAFEVIALFCGILPGHEAIVGIGANAIVNNVSSLAYMLYLGTSVSANVRIGNALGAGQVHRAQMASYLAMALGGLLSLMNVAIIISFRHGLCSLFTSDDELVEKATSLMFVVALFQVPDAINASCQGVFQASGRQALAAKLNFVAYYLIGLPLAYVLGIQPLHFSVEGLWYGMTVGLFFVAIASSSIVIRSEWRHLSLQARARLSIVPTTLSDMRLSFSHTDIQT